MKKLLLLFLLVLVGFGCKNFETKKLDPDQIFKNEVEEIDWDNLDTYPSFKTCDKYPDKKAKKECFEQEFSNQVYKALGEHEIVLKDSIHEKIKLQIAISNKGEPKIKEMNIPDKVEDQIPSIKKWLKESVADLPKIQPAEKRGVPVRATFTMPLLIQSGEE